MNLMRILHVVLTLDRSHGGPTTVATRLSAAQAGLGHDVTLATYSSVGGHEWLEGDRDGLPHNDRVQYHLYPAPSLHEKVFARDARRRGRELMRGCDFVHIHTLWASISVATAIAARETDVPYAVIPHGHLFPWSLRKKRLKKKIAMRLGWDAMLRGAMFIHALNRDEKTAIDALNLPCPSVVIPNAIFTEEIEAVPHDGSFRARYPELGDGPYILYLGRLDPEKGLAPLVDSFTIVAEHHAAARLVFVGPDTGGLRDLNRHVERSGHADRVHVMGPIYGPGKIAALREAACLCLPSQHECFSVSTIEAMACGTPIVISDRCHFSELTEIGAGVIVPLEPSAIAEALLGIVRDPARGRTMGAKGKAFVFDQLNWPVAAARTIETYESCLAAPTTARTLERA